MTIGYIGLGNMGGALAARLQLSYPLLVHDRLPEAVERLRAQGASVGDPQEIARRCRVVLLCLPTSDHVREALFGAQGVASHLAPGTLIIDQTTGEPRATRGFARELAESGVEFIDAPVSGGVAGARAGTIAVMVGAEPASFERALPYLKAISPNVFHAGGVGAGHVIKIVNNLLSTTQRVLSFEAMALAAKNGVDPARALEILLAGGGRNGYLEKQMARVLKGDLRVGFTLGLAAKDLRLACQLGAETGVPMLLGAAAREMYEIATAERGAEGEVDTIAQVYDRLAGTQMVPPDAKDN